MIFRADCTGFSPAFYDAAAKTLPKEKRATVEKIRHRQTKEQSLLGWAMVALVRARMGLPADSPLRFSEHGKPYYEGESFHFNLSHSGDYVCLAVADAPVGADVQTVTAPSDAMVRRVLSENEQAALASAADPALAFTALWTMKECWLKYTGTGIIDALESLDFSEHLDADAFTFEGACFTVFRARDHVLTVCGKEAETAVQTLTSRDFF